MGFNSAFKGLRYIKNAVDSVARVIRAGVETNTTWVGWHSANACYYYVGNTRFGFLLEKRLFWIRCLVLQLTPANMTRTLQWCG